MDNCIGQRLSREQIIFGTNEPAPEPRHLACGPLSAILFGGNLRYVRWGGLEIVRSVSVIVRDTRWGTYPLDIDKLRVVETPERFKLSYIAQCRGDEGDFGFHAVVEGSADGRLDFKIVGSSQNGFATNRAGFALLYPLKGVVGRRLEVRHTGGRQSVTCFPDNIDPNVVATDIRALVSSPPEGLKLTVAFSGEAFEMEDHRNWCDASFKIYARPRSLGIPYRIAPGEQVVQSTSIEIEGPPPPAAPKKKRTTVSLASAIGRIPAIGMFVEPGAVESTRQVARHVAALGPAFLMGRVDLREDDSESQFAALSKLCAEAETRLALQAVIPGLAPGRELEPLTHALTASSVALDSLHVLRACDLQNWRDTPAVEGMSTQSCVLTTARRLFPGITLAGGKPTPFVELNRDRPPPGFDFITHATQATTHDADDLSVMETLQALPFVIRSARALAAGVPLRIGPATIGRSRFSATAAPLPNQNRQRLCNVAEDPRQSGLFGAAFALGYAATAAREGVEGLTLAAACGPFGVFAGPDDAALPLASVIGGLGRLRGAQQIATAIESAEPLAAMAAETSQGLELWLANIGANPVPVAIKGAEFETLAILDAKTYAKGEQMTVTEMPGGVIELNSYAICRLCGPVNQ